MVWIDLKLPWEGKLGSGERGSMLSLTGFAHTLSICEVGGAVAAPRLEESGGSGRTMAPFRLRREFICSSEVGGGEAMGAPTQSIDLD